MENNKLSLLDLPYDCNNSKPVYTSAFDRPVRKRDGFIAKIRSIYGRKFRH